MKNSILSLLISLMIGMFFGYFISDDSEKTKQETAKVVTIDEDIDNPDAPALFVQDFSSDDQLLVVETPVFEKSVQTIINLNKVPFFGDSSTTAQLSTLNVRPFNMCFNLDVSFTLLKHPGHGTMDLFTLVFNPSVVPFYYPMDVYSLEVRTTARARSPGPQVACSVC